MLSGKEGINWIERERFNWLKMFRLLGPPLDASAPQTDSQSVVGTRLAMISMNDPAVGMIPFDGIGLYEQQPKPRFIFKMPRVVPDQKAKFESDELFRRLSRESEVGSVLTARCKKLKE